MNMKRLPKEGRVSVGEWSENEYEKLAAKSFKKYLERALIEEPPYIALSGGNARDQKLIVSIPALGYGDLGSTWEFSLRELIERDTEGWGLGCCELLAKSLRGLVDQVDKILLEKQED